MKKFLKQLGLGLVLLTLLLQIIPFLIPVRQGKAIPVEQPFENSHFFRTSDGVDLHYRTWSSQGEKKGQILMVHGLGGSTFTWRFTSEALAKAGYFVVAVDLPGFGYSTRVTGLDHSQKQRSQWLWELLDELDQTRAKNAGSSWHLLGHSMGGGTVTSMAMARPQQTASLLLADGALFDNNPSFVGVLLRYPPLSRGVRVVLERVLLSEERIGDLLASAYGRPLSEEEQSGYAIPLLLPGTMGSLIDLIKTAKSEPIQTDLIQNIPVLALWGQEDSWVPFHATERIAKVLPQIQVAAIPGAGHCPMETHAEEFEGLLLEFLISK